MKLTKKAIKTLMEKTPAALDNADIRAVESVFLGTYQRADANWCWEVYAIAWGGHPYVVVSRFGRICAEGK
jgi:hypothetical protein